MIAAQESGQDLYIAPRENEEHAGMLEFAGTYVMTTEYKYLPEDVKLLIDQHIRERKEMLIAAETGQQPPPGGMGVTSLPGSPGVSGALRPDVQEEPLPPQAAPLV